MRDVVSALREIGAIDGLTAAVHQSIIVARDTTREISELLKATGIRTKRSTLSS